MLVRADALVWFSAYVLDEKNLIFTAMNPRKLPPSGVPRYAGWAKVAVCSGCRVNATWCLPVSSTSACLHQPPERG